MVNSKTQSLTAFVLILFFFCLEAFPQVKYDEGREVVNGIQLLQHRDNESAYSYITPYPRISSKEDGSLELLCLKYVGEGGDETNGGIFHALIEYSLPSEVVEELESELKKKVGAGASIKGPVPMMQALDDGETGVATFEVVSGILSDTEGEGALTQSLITSGFAPLLPGSKAAIAARLNQTGATLLWESLQGPTSDVSVSVHGYYEAAVKGYNAVISAESSTIYEHYSRVLNNQSGYEKTELRKISDELIQDQVLKIDVFDRSQGLGIKTDDMQAIVDLVTDKLVELMFDASTGWAAKPERETAIEQGQIPKRQERGFFAKLFAGTGNQKYISDTQFVLKRREDIRVNKFYLNLSKSTTIKVPVHTSGNIGGIYDSLVTDNRYFRIVNLDDKDFQKRDVHFQIDGNFVESFTDVINFVTVNFRKQYPNGHDDVTRDIFFRRADLNEGVDLKSLQYPRLGDTESDWLNYEYKILWSLKGNDKPVPFPRSKDKWVQAKSPAISLTPPFKKKVIEIDADRTLFNDQGVRSATVRFFVTLGGKAQAQRTVVLRSTDSESFSKVALYYDEKEPLAYQVSWYSTEGSFKESPKVLDEDYLFLLPPDKEAFIK